MIVFSAVRNVFGVCVLTIAMAACATPDPTPKYPELTYRYLPPIKLDVAAVEVVTTYKPPLREPNVDHLSPLPPAAAAVRWANDRIKAVGSSGKARVIISNGSIVEVPLKKTGGLKGVITTDQSERYDGVLEVTIEIRSDRGYRDAFVEAKATRTRSVPENSSLNDRERVWFKMAEDLMNEVNAQFDQTIPKFFTRWLR